MFNKYHNVNYPCTTLYCEGRGTP